MKTSYLAALGAAAAVAFAASAAGSPGATPGLHGNNFWSNCRFSHTANDDPIVLPGHPGLSHLHTFFGNVSTNAYSTFARLRRSSTTCRPPADRAAYWVPTLLRDGREVRPEKAQLYYVVLGYRQMRAFPSGLRMIAGDAHAGTPQSSLVTYWDCAGNTGIRSEPSAAPPARCGTVSGTVFTLRKGSTRLVPMKVRSKTRLELRVNFPDCWDGKHLDSLDHKSHMAYSRHFVCPRSHPVKVPAIRLLIRYPVTSAKGLTLSSGGLYSAHADFFNAWNQRTLVGLVDDCFHGRGCDPYKAMGAG
ncbi:MAG TPA: DUF1996 domain-containing protein [Gaiellaceae bacterium]